MPTNEEKKDNIIEKGIQIEGLKQNPGWEKLLEATGIQAESFNLADSTSWDDFQYRKGVLKGLSLLKEVADITIAVGKRARRGKKVY